MCPTVPHLVQRDNPVWVAFARTVCPTVGQNTFTIEFFVVPPFFAIVVLALFVVGRQRFEL